MRVSEIESQISVNNREVAELQKKINDLYKKNNSLVQLRDSKLLESFIDYIEVGTTYNFTTYAYLTGIQTGGTGVKPNFMNGDSIEFIKKNSKSIVVKCTTKVVSHFDINNIRTKSITNPNWTFRIDIMSLFVFMRSRPEFKTGFDSYVRRRESLESLGI
jgi:hypothetical protein